MSPGRVDKCPPTPSPSSRSILPWVLLVCVSWPASRDTGADDSPATPRALIVTGVDYPGHEWKKTTPLLRNMLEEKPGFRVTVTEDPWALDSLGLGDYDLVVLHFMDWERPSPGGRVRDALRDYVERGGGLLLVHFACGAFQDWPGFVELSGRVWDPDLRGHDPRGPFRVEFTAEGKRHPATRGMSDFETDDELYTCLRGDLPVKILATARSRVDRKDYPMAFVFSVKKGRVFHTPLGHDARALGFEGVRDLFRRGCRWAARRAEEAERGTESSAPENGEEGP